MAAADRRKQKAVIATQTTTPIDTQPPSGTAAVPSSSQAVADFSAEPSTTDTVSAGTVEGSGSGSVTVGSGVMEETVESTAGADEAMETDTVIDPSGGVGSATAVISVS